VRTTRFWNNLHQVCSRKVNYSDRGRDGPRKGQAIISLNGVKKHNEISRLYELVQVNIGSRAEMVLYVVM